MTIRRCLTPTNVPAHGYIQQHRHISHRPRSRWNLTLHYWLSVDVPDHSSLARLAIWLVPGKVISHWATVHVVNASTQDSMLLRLVVEAPMETRMVFVVSVPCFGNVYLAIRWPRERLARQKPEGRPDTGGARG